MNQKQSEYIANYNKNNYKMYQFRIKKTEDELIKLLDSIPKRNSYIAELIKNDMFPDVLTLKEIKQRIRPIMRKHRIDDVYLFGSYARGEARNDSDVDIYCSHGDINTLTEEVAFINELEDALGKKVDLVTIGSQMHEYFRQQLEEDMIKIC